MKRRFGLQKAGPRNRSDQRAELLLGALACVVLALIAGMIIFVFQKAWPSFSHNGFDWFNPFAGGSVDDELVNIFESPANPSQWVYTMHAWPLLYATILITFFAVVIGVASPCSRRCSSSSSLRSRYAAFSSRSCGCWRRSLP